MKLKKKQTQPSLIKMKRVRRTEKLGLYLITFGVAIVFMFPLYIVISSSIKPNISMFSRPPAWVFMPTLDHFRDIFTLRRFHENVINSTIVALGSTFVSITFGSLGAYALARLKYKRMKDLAFWILSMRMFPPIAVVIPYYMLLRNIGLLDTPLGLILVYSTFNVPLTVWLMKGFFAEIPEDMEESAQVDGCTHLSAFIRITLPLAAPGIVVCSVFCFIFSWNEFLFAFMLTSSKTMTATVAVMGFWSTEAIEWGRIMAGSVVVLIPIIIFVFACQKFLIKGLTLGSIK
jgi:multiple sugar transport system permease protein